MWWVLADPERELLRPAKAGAVGSRVNLERVASTEVEAVIVRPRVEAEGSSCSVCTTER
jgi:hypothetical protein